ncbi:MAG: hypothetical protein H7A55_10750 [Verrucomicrobiaceae bacterium]|nr:hypothetical protein [Verrucomicrobiaceae bacterium]
MKSVALYCVTLLFVSSLRADEPVAVDPDLPQPFDADSVADVFTESAFTRMVNLEDTLQLTGVAYIDGRPVATFYNTATGKHLTVSDQPNADGWRLVSAIPGSDLRETEVQVAIGPETIVARYGSVQLQPGGSKKGEPTSRLAGGSGGNSTLASGKSGGHMKTSSYLGQDGKAMYAALSSEARGKLKDLVHNFTEKHPEMSVEQSSAYAQKVYAKIKAADRPSTVSAAPKTKTPKVRKQK